MPIPRPFTLQRSHFTIPYHIHIRAELESPPSLTSSHTASVGLFVPLPAATGQGTAVADFLRTGHGMLAAEPDTLGWYALEYDATIIGANAGTTFAGDNATYAIFDTFAGEEGRGKHVGGEWRAVVLLPESA